MLSTFYMLMYILFREMSFLHFLIKLFRFVLLLGFESPLYILNAGPFIGYVVLQIFSSNLIFHSFHMGFPKANVLIVMRLKLSSFSFRESCFGSQI